MTGSILGFHTLWVKSSTRRVNRVRTTVMLDPRLLAAAKDASGAVTNNAVIEIGLRELERKAALRRLADNLAAPDRRFKAASRRRAG